MIFEDDATEIAGRFAADISIPSQADCCYLGTCTNGHRHELQTPWIYNPISPPSRPLYVQEHNHDWYRIAGMMSSHALVVLTQDFANALSRQLENLEGADVNASRLMPKYNVYAVRKNRYYQADGHNEPVTTPDLESGFAGTYTGDPQCWYTPRKSAETTEPTRQPPTE
jgi:hypothetical protein